MLTGWRLCEALIAHAATDGFERMRLDTGKLFAPLRAGTLSRRGLPLMVFMELSLQPTNR
jgi:hypothetical protein